MQIKTDEESIKNKKTKNATRETFYLFYLTISFIMYLPTDGDTLLVQ
jgi:hypothetical protein